MLTPRAALACVALGVAMALPAAANLPAPLPAFEGARVTPVLTAARLHGIPTRIRHFAADAPLDKVRGFYRNVLGKPHLDTTIAGWSVLALKRGDHLLTVRLRAVPHGAGGVEGTLSEADLAAPESTRPHPHELRLPTGGRLLTDVEADDPGRSVRTLSWQTGQSITASRAYLIRELATRGLHLERALPSTERNPHGLSLWFSGTDREAIATIVRSEGGTTVTVNLITASGNQP